MSPGASVGRVSPLRLVASKHHVAVAGRETAQTMCHSPGAVVVLGGTGFVGSAITRGLVADGYDVTVAARRLPVDLDRLSGARVLQRDAADPAIYDELLDGASAVVYALGSLFPRSRTRHHWWTSTTRSPRSSTCWRRFVDVPRCRWSSSPPVARSTATPGRCPSPRTTRPTRRPRTGSSSSPARSTSGCAGSCAGTGASPPGVEHLPALPADRSGARSDWRFPRSRRPRFTGDGLRDGVHSARLHPRR